MTNSYSSVCDAIRTSILESQQFPLFKSLLEQTPIDYKSNKTDIIVNALLGDETLSKYSILSIFDDRILVTDNGHSFYHLPYEIDKVSNKLKFKTIIPISLVQNEALLVKTVLLEEIQKMIVSYNKGKISENIEKIVELGLEKLRLDSLQKLLEKNLFEETVPVMLLRAPVLMESWSNFSKEYAKNTLVEKVEIITESYEALYQFRKFLENEKGVKYGHYVNARDVDSLIGEYEMYQGRTLEERERATLINFYKNRVNFLHENSIIEDGMGGMTQPEFYEVHPDVFGSEVSADFTPENTARNSSMLINYKPILVSAREFLSKLLSGTLPGDLKKIVSSLLIKVDTTLVRMDTNYNWAMQDMYDLQDLLRTVNKMISIASGLATIKATVGVEEPSNSTPTPDSSITPSKSYLGNDTKLEITATSGIATYPAGFKSKLPVGNAYPNANTRVGESVIIRDGCYFIEGRVKDFSIYTGLYEIQLQDGKVLKLDEYMIEFQEDKPVDVKKKKEEDDEILPTKKPKDKEDILVDMK